MSDTALALWAESSAVSLKLFRTLKQRYQSLPHVSIQPATESPTQVTIGTQSPSNDQTDALTKAGALHKESWTFHALPPNPSVAEVTHRQHATGAQTPAPSHMAISPQFAADDLLTLQNADSSLRTMAAHMSDPLEHPISSHFLTHPPSSARSTLSSTYCICETVFSCMSLSHSLRQSS